MAAIDPAEVWASADYVPTARRLAPAAAVVARHLADSVPAGSVVVDLGAGHGHVASRLLERGLQVVAVDPIRSMLEVGERRVPGARWVLADGEVTGLAPASVAGIASSFGAVFCDPHRGPAEWERILVPGGSLVFTAWDQRGFLAEMTRRMMAVVAPGGGQPAHMSWGEDQYAVEALRGGFEDITIEHRDLPWGFPDVEAGMRLYLQGSPTHAWALKHAGESRQALLEALRRHLRESAGPTGSIQATAGYALIQARRRRR